MEDKETVYDILNHFKNTKNRLTQGGDSDFITLDYKQLLALIELSKREQQELNKANEKLKKIEEYITSYESISTIQGLNDTKENKNLDKNTIVEMTNRYFKIHDKILSIIKGGKE